MRRLFLIPLLIALIGIALVTTGCTVTNTSAAAPKATVVDGIQTIKVDSQGQFVPAATAQAGVPIRLEFGPGGGCTAAIQFKDHGVYEDLTDGGGTVDLPGLQAGQYPLLCQSDMVMGTLTVE